MLQTKVILKNRLILILLAALLIMSFIDTYSGWRFLLIGLGGVWLICYFWARSMAANVRVKREMRFGWAQVGDLIEERFTLSNFGWIPCIWCEICDHSDMPGYITNRVTGVEASSNNRWRTKGKCIRRGLFRLGPTTIHTTDPFHLFQVEIHDPNSINLLVTPPIIPLPDIEIAPGGGAGEGRTRIDAPERTVSVSSVREYLPGDSMRWIHWRTSARRDKYYVRLFDSTPAGDWWVIADLDSNVQVEIDEYSTRENGIILAASLANKGLNLGNKVGFIGTGEPFIWLPPDKGQGQRWKILHSLALVNNGNTSLDKLLVKIRPTLGIFSSITIITPQVKADWIEELLPLLWGGAVATVMILDHQSAQKQNKTKYLIELLNRYGIRSYMISKDVLNQPESQPGKRGQWEWKISATGRVLVTSKPQDLSWKEMI